ncbi:hypothetical protein HMPREF3098_07410 [Corynebacterium sp. HMSC28B08]|nr:hypothetical protein HMPREF3098_07410 [Corynebacterium sp. HMSC28B08]
MGSATRRGRGLAEGPPGGGWQQGYGECLLIGAFLLGLSELSFDWDLHCFTVYVRFFKFLSEGMSGADFIVVAGVET